MEKVFWWLIKHRRMHGQAYRLDADRTSWLVSDILLTTNQHNEQNATRILTGIAHAIWRIDCRSDVTILLPTGVLLCNAKIDFHPPPVVYVLSAHTVENWFNDFGFDVWCIELRIKAVVPCYWRRYSKYWSGVSDFVEKPAALCVTFFTARCTIVQSAVLRLHAVRLSVCPFVMWFLMISFDHNVIS